MIKNTARILATCALLFLVPTIAAADATPYLERMMAGYESPFEMAFSMTMSMDQGGMSMDVEGSGEMTWADPTHSKMNMDMNMNMPGSDQPMVMSLKTVTDGETIWTEMSSPMTGTQVMKMAVADINEIVASQGLGAIGGGIGSNPLEQLKTMQAFFDFEVAGIADGEVTLTGTMRDDAPAMFAQAGEMIGIMTMVLDEKTGTLRYMEMGVPDAPTVTMTVDRYSRLTAADVSLSQFNYTPPEGAMMMSSPELEGGTQ